VLYEHQSRMIGHRLTPGFCKTIEFSLDSGYRIANAEFRSSHIGPGPTVKGYRASSTTRGNASASDGGLPLIRCLALTVVPAMGTPPENLYPLFGHASCKSRGSPGQGESSFLFRTKSAIVQK
jgi:hypothetical protein